MHRIPATEGAELFASVCFKHDPFTDCINPLLPFRGIFFPTNGYELSVRQWNAVVAAQRTLGGGSFILLPTELPFEAWENFGCWEITAENGYSLLPRKLSAPPEGGISYQAWTIENSIIDREGRWVIMVSQEFHALIGGTAEFGSELERNYHSLENERQVFKKFCDDKGLSLYK